MLRMKEIWYYHIGLFADGERLHKALRKEQDARAYERLTDEIFRTLPLRPTVKAVWQKEAL